LAFSPLPSPRCWRKQQYARGGGENSSTLDTVQVTGVRSSLQKSQIIKQDFIGTVDAVSAEDVGKFPDQNVADALQRVPGVSVDRSGGESRFITVRGFGPEFNAVTLNGRIMATENDGREFSFDILPSELISAAEVQKTSTANAPEGSIGASVNIRTQRPLDNPGFHVAAAVAGTYDNGSENTKPKISALISHTNADRTLGGLLSLVHYQRSHVTERATTSGWLTNAPGLGGIAVPRSTNYDLMREDRTRSGVNAALDWHLSDTLKLGVDAMYTKYNIDSDGNALWFFTDTADIVDIRGDENNTATWFKRNGLDFSHVRFSETNAVRERDSTNKQVGANLSWNIGEYTTLEFDGSWSKADNNPDSHKGFFTSFLTELPDIDAEWNLNPGGFPGYKDLPPLTDASNLMPSYSRVRARRTSDEIGEFRTHLAHNFYDGMLSRLQFGASVSSRSKDNHTVRTSDALNNAYGGARVRVPAELAEIFNAGNVADTGGPTQWLTRLLKYPHKPHYFPLFIFLLKFQRKIFEIFHSNSI